MIRRTTGLVTISVLKYLESTSLCFFNPEYLERTYRFFEKYGGKTIIIARFIPIIRTFAPFIAGIGRMSYFRFALYNVLGVFLGADIYLYGLFPWQFAHH